MTSVPADRSRRVVRRAGRSRRSRRRGPGRRDGPCCGAPAVLRGLDELDGHDSRVEMSDVTRAIAAATSVAASLELPANDAIVLHNSNKLALRLTPCDVLARVAQVGHEAPVWLEERRHSVSAKTYVADAALPRLMPIALASLRVGAVTDREVTRALVSLSRSGLAEASVRRFGPRCPRSSRGPCVSE